jgi:hypothetical protein
MRRAAMDGRNGVIAVTTSTSGQRHHADPVWRAIANASATPAVAQGGDLP